MKNLCFLCFCTGDKGGVNRIVASLCNELSNNKKYNVHILSICSEEPILAYEVNENITVQSIGAKSSWRLRRTIVYSFAKILKYFNENQIDITFMIGHYTPPIVFLTKLFAKCKFVFCDHGALENQLDDKKATIFRKMASKMSDKVIVLTKRSKEAYKKYFGLDDKKVEYIYNFLDNSMLKFSKEYNCKSKKLLTVGRVSPEKGYDMIIDIAKEILNNHTDWEWHVYGDGSELSSLKIKAQTAGLQGKLVFKGGGYNIYEIYKEYSIFVLTSYREGLPLVLLEAKANGLPIVSFDCVTGPSEIIRDGIDGYLIECYNKQQMIAKLLELIENVSLRVSLSACSKENLADFDKDMIVSKWENLIDNL